MKQETIDGNRLIAEFMGFKKVQGKFYGGMKDDKENSTFPAWSDTMNIILDTHLGSGSSRIAAYKGGFNFVGFEIDQEYYEKQEKRFNDFKSQLRLF